VQIERGESRAGADSEHRAIGAKADEREVARKLGKPVWRAVRQVGHAVEPVGIATTLKTVSPLHEGKAPLTNSVLIGLRLGEGGLSGKPSGRGSPDGVELAGRGQALFHVI
jgi:hypothetical protein